MTNGYIGVHTFLIKSSIQVSHVSDMLSVNELTSQQDKRGIEIGCIASKVINLSAVRLIIFRLKG